MIQRPITLEQPVHHQDQVTQYSVLTSSWYAIKTHSLELNVDQQLALQRDQVTCTRRRPDLRRKEIGIDTARKGLHVKLTHFQKTIPVKRCLSNAAKPPSSIRAAVN